MITLKMLRESGKRKLFVIPYLFTFGNAFFGFLAVIKTFEYDFVTAAYCIMAAAVMDMFDGRLARAFNSSSYLGIELDSLSDSVSFCFAPVVLLYSAHLNEAGALGIVALTTYLCAGLLRLAKFNLIASQDGISSYFSGLPTPIAALFVIQLVISYEWLSDSYLNFLVQPIGIIVTAFILAFLMVSLVRFPSFKLVKINSINLFFTLIGLVALTGFLFLNGVPILLLGLGTYILSGILLELSMRLFSFYNR